MRPIISKTQMGCAVEQLTSMLQPVAEIEYFSSLLERCMSSIPTIRPVSAGHPMMRMSLRVLDAVL